MLDLDAHHSAPRGKRRLVAPQPGRICDQRPGGGDSRDQGAAGHDGHDLLASPAPDRVVWVGESGLCDPGCAEGCSPAGHAGKDRVVYGPQSTWLDRPGRSPSGDAALAPHLADWPRAMDPTGARDDARGQALGYTDPHDAR